MSNEHQALDLYGKDLTHDRLKSGYETHSSYAKQGNTRVVKALLFPVHLRVASPMFPDAEVIKERNLRRGERVTVEELGLIALEKGERLGAFYTDEELARGGPKALPSAPVQLSSEDLENDSINVSELGAHELVDWLNTGKDGGPVAVNDILEVAGNDPDFAKRLIEAEKTRDPDDPRKTLIGSLTKVAESGA